MLVSYWIRSTLATQYTDANRLIYTLEDDHLVVGTNPVETAFIDRNALPTENPPTRIVIQEKVQSIAVTIIGAGAFRSSKIISVFIPASITLIKMDAFAYANKLRTVIFAENSKLTRLNQGVFYNDKVLKNLRIPDSVTFLNGLALGHGYYENIYYCGSSNFDANIFQDNIGIDYPPKNVHVHASYPYDTFGGVNVMKDYNCEVISYFNVPICSCLYRKPNHINLISALSFLSFLK